MPSWIWKNCHTRPSPKYNHEILYISSYCSISFLLHLHTIKKGYSCPVTAQQFNRRETGGYAANSSSRITTSMLRLLTFCWVQGFFPFHLPGIKPSLWDASPLKHQKRPVLFKRNLLYYSVSSALFSEPVSSFTCEDFSSRICLFLIAKFCTISSALNLIRTQS